MVFSSYGNSSSFYLPLDSDQGVTSFYKNENAALLTAPTSVVCRGNQDNSTMSPGAPVQPFGNNSHGTVVVDAVRHDFAPVAHLSSNGYYGYVPPQQPRMMSTPAAVNAAACDVQLEDAAMDCGEMENFQQLQQNQQHQHPHQRKRKEYGEEAMASKRRKTWLEEEQQQQAGFPQTFGWNQLPYASHHQQMDCHVEDTPMTTTVIGSCNGTFAPTQPATTIPVATVTPIQHPVQPPKNHPLVNGHSGGSARRDLLGRWNIAMPTSRPSGTGCSTVSQLSEKLHSHQLTIGGGQELEDLFVSLHGSGFFLTG